jgi:hypothetical protein
VREGPAHALVVERGEPPVEAEVVRTEHGDTALERVGRVSQVRALSIEEVIEATGPPVVVAVPLHAETDGHFAHVPPRAGPEGVGGKQHAVVIELGNDKRAVPDEGARLAPRVPQRLDPVARPGEQRCLG